MIILFLRTLIVYVTLLAVLRLLGKRQLGEMELSEFVVAALIADMAAHPLQDLGIPLINGLVPMLTLFCCEVLIAGVSLKSIRLRKLLFGKPSLLITRGVIDQREMRKNRFTLDELTQELRSQGAMDLSKIEYAILETNGKLTVIPFPAEKPVTAAMLGLGVEDGGCPFILICDGRVLSENLRRSGKDEAWLRDELQRRGAKSAREVFLLSVNAAGQVYYCAKEASHET